MYAGFTCIHRNTEVYILSILVLTNQQMIRIINKLNILLENILISNADTV